MKIKDYICKCGHNDFFFADKGNQKGIYCSYCGRWLKWADKDEQNLAMKQESVLDKIRAEIEQEIIPRNSDQYDHDAMWQNLGLRMALKVIDKYKAETENP